VLDEREKGGRVGKASGYEKESGGGNVRRSEGVSRSEVEDVESLHVGTVIGGVL
jgi:hypothetical protein